MKRWTQHLLLGLLLSTPPLALAVDTQASGDSARPSPAPSPDAESTPGTPRAFSGPVLGTAPGTLFVTGPSGASIPIRVTHQTRIAGMTVPRDQDIETYLREHLKPGRSVRVQFDVRPFSDGTPQNVASTVEPKASRELPPQ
ncbi:hypothetical protein [Myxococcus qinghaiensis]|uniref:hypothetical protein n=1 Tax=Myxococcus qinghaiensis TaxID=2906758 RepID=UPI0020A6FCD4|nr:hypothetical protein [Myxococcus qinghaiensis]MCP3167926.1 hypothetical protein [Myxococcus qinghaiensis]